jgi:hypothetical protein
MSAPQIRTAPANEATIDEQPTDATPLSIWQRPFMQNVLPLGTSILLHAAVVIAGIATYQVVQRINVPSRDLPFVATSAFIDPADTAATLHPGPLGSHPERSIAQADLQNVKDLDGLSKTQGKSLAEALSGGTSGSGQSAMELAIGWTPATAGGGRGTGGDGPGDGPGGPGGKIAPFGLPDGGDGGLRFSGGKAEARARKIIFVLDATGSMMASFDALRVQIRTTIVSMRPPQSFNLIFINEHVPVLSPALLFATPESKRRAIDFVDAVAPRGPTDPLPALEKAFAQKPDLIYFLIDPSDFPDKKAVLDLVAAKAAGRRIKMNIIAFEGHDPENEAFLKSLAEKTGGEYRFVTGQELEAR